MTYQDLISRAEQNPSEVYVIGSQSQKPLGNLIVWFSSFVDKKLQTKHSLDHVVLASYQNKEQLLEQIHQTDPHTKRQKYSPRKLNVVYKIKDNIAPIAWMRAHIDFQNKEKNRYGYAQLIGKVFYALFGLKLFRGGKDCIEAVVRWINDTPSEIASYYTVAEGIHVLEKEGKIEYIGEFKI